MTAFPYHARFSRCVGYTHWRVTHLLSKSFFVLLVLFFIVLWALPARGQLQVPLTIQEAIYPGVGGISRTQEPVTVGIPLPESAGITSTSELGLTGASAGQFRILGRWPSGNAKWVLIDTLADLTAGGKNTTISLTRGVGSFGGPNLAKDNGATITVNTGPAQFTIRKAHFNLFDRVVVNGRALVIPGASQGLILTGPPPGLTTCGACTTTYASSYDSTSKAEIKENGPVKAVLKATGAHKNAAGNVYLRFTVRLTFYKGKSYVKVTSELRNSDNNTTPFQSAYKGFKSYEVQLAPRLEAKRQFAIGTDTQPVTRPFSGSEDVYLYQAYSDNMEHSHWRMNGVVSYIPRKRGSDPATWIYAQEGYRIAQGSLTLASGTRSQHPQGWADLSDSTGAGVLVGVYQLSGYWPKSLEFRSGGTDIRVGLWPKYNVVPYYQAWPQYSSHDLFFCFHDAALSSPGDESLKFQHYLLARAPIDQYNDSKVFPYVLLDPAEEDGYYRSLGLACCITDVNPEVFRYYHWPAGGPSNQAEYKWAYLLQWITRGSTGRYLWAAHFYRFQADQAFPRSDGFSWRDAPNSALNPDGLPTAASKNNLLAHRSWIDGEHAHWYGMTDYYFMTGDESIRDALLDGVKDRFLNPHTSVNNGRLWNPRSIGCALLSLTRLYQFLSATADPDANVALQIADQVLNHQVFPDLRVSDFGTASKSGISRTRGLSRGCCSFAGFGRLHEVREAQTFQHSILIQGLWEYAQVRGRGWYRYDDLMDLAYGAGEWALKEMYVNTGDWRTSGFRYIIAIDFPIEFTSQFAPEEFQRRWTQIVWFPFFIVHEHSGDTSWKQSFENTLKENSYEWGTNWPEFGIYSVDAVLYKLLHPSTTKLVDVPLKVTNNSGGSYTLSWVAPAGAQSYRIKYAPRRIVEWLNFDPMTNTFGVDPTWNVPWFAAPSLSNPPPPEAAGTTQTLVIEGLDPGKNWSFSIKAYVSAGAHPVPSPN